MKDVRLQKTYSDWFRLTDFLTLFLLLLLLFQSAKLVLGLDLWLDTIPVDSRWVLLVQVGDHCKPGTVRKVFTKALCKFFPNNIY